MDGFLKTESSISYSYVYEEDDPQKNHATNLGDLLNDRPIQVSRHNTPEVRFRNKLIREAYFQGQIFDDKECNLINYMSTIFIESHKIVEMIFDENIKDKKIVEDKLRD